MKAYIDGIYYDLDTSSHTATVVAPFPHEQYFNDYFKDYFKMYCYDENYDEYYGDIIIPEKIFYKRQIYTVVAIANGTFANACIDSIVIPNSILHIGNSAFSCSNLKKILSSENISYIGKEAFHDTPWFEEQPDGIIYIGKVLYAYKGEMPNDASIIVKDGIISITACAFDNYEEFYDDYDDYSNIFYRFIPYPLISITLPNTLTTIGDKAFRNCPQLSTIDIPDSVTYVGGDVFDGTSWYDNQPDGIVRINNVVYKLKGIELTEDILSFDDNVIAISPYAFDDTNICANITELRISKNITNIGDSAFCGCNNLTSIVVNADNPIYDSRSNCNAIIETASQTLLLGCPDTRIPTGVLRISNFAFLHCKESLTSICIPKSVNYIADKTFHNCPNLQSIVVDPKNQRYDSRDNCNALIEYNKLIVGCQNTIIPDGITTIGENAFGGCAKLESILIPESVTKIEDNAFKGCHNLKRIFLLSSTLPELYAHSFPNNNDDENRMALYVNMWNNHEHSLRYSCSFSFCDFHIYDISFIVKDIHYAITGLHTVKVIANINPYRDCAYKEHSTIDIPETVFYNGIKFIIIEIDKSAFQNCENLVTVSLPNTIVKIGDYAFEWCEKLTDVVIPPNVIEIGERAFSGSNLQSIVIPESVKFIGEHAFSSGENLVEIRIESKKTKYDSRNNCHAMIDTTSNSLIVGCQNTIIPNNIKIIKEFAFCDSSLTSIIIPPNVTEIEDYAFLRSDLTSINIPDSVTHIGEFAFCKCYFLKSVSLNHMTKIIEASTFQHCVNLTSIDIPNNITSIGKNAFDECTSLTSITLHEGIKHIEDFAFRNCKNLQLITLPNSVVSIGRGAFEGCTSLTSINIPSNVSSIGDCAFENCSNLSFMSVHTDNKTYDSRENCNAIIHTKSNRLIRGCNNTKIPNSIQSIEHNAFSCCLKLRKIKIPKNVSKIEERTFLGCTKLQEINIPHVTSIEEEAFKDCSNLVSIYTQELKSIDRKAIIGCSVLHAITIPGKCCSISIEGCSQLDRIVCLSENLYIEGLDSVKQNITMYVPNDLVEKYTNKYKRNNLEIKSIEFKEDTISYKMIGTHSVSVIYSEDYKELSDISIPEKVYYGGTLLMVVGIEAHAFLSCSKLISISIPKSIKHIEMSAFAGCYFEKNNFVNSSKLSESKNRYWGATIIDEDINGLLIKKNTIITHRKGIKTIIIPETVAGINKDAFCDLVVPKEHFINKSSCISSDYWGARIADKEVDGLLICDNELLKYQGNATDVKIPNGITLIANKAFKGCTFVHSVVIPNSVTHIGREAFSGCSALSTIEIPTSVIFIDEDAFFNTLWYEEQQNNIIYINHILYKNKGNSNTNITIKEGTESISPGAFRNCTSLRTVNMPSSVGEIGYDAFYGCSGLKHIEFEEVLLDDIGYSEPVFFNIGNGTFHGCKSLDSSTRGHIMLYACYDEDIDTLFDDTWEQTLDDLELLF